VRMCLFMRRARSVVLGNGDRPLADAGHHCSHRPARTGRDRRCRQQLHTERLRDGDSRAVDRAPEAPVLVGHSMGGASTSQFAEHHSGM